jgi:hypothetical protein
MYIFVLYFPESSFKTSNSYLETASNMESLTQRQIKTNIILLLPHTFHLPKITLPTMKNQQIAWNKEKTFLHPHTTKSTKEK